MSTFEKKISDFDLNLLIGSTAEATQVDYDGRMAWNFIIPGFYSVTNVANTDLRIGQSMMRKRLVGAYGEFRASYRDFAYLTVSGRRSEEHTSELQSRGHLVCRLL